MTNELAIERAHKRKANTISFVFHIGLLLIAFFATCDPGKAIDKQYAVALNFEEIIPPKLEEFKEASNSNKGREAEGAPRKNADKVAEIKDQQTKTVETKRPEVKLPKPTPTPPTPTDPVISETTMEDDTEITAAEEEIEIDNPEPEPIPEPIPEPEVAEPTPEPIPEQAKESVKTKIGKILDVIKAGGSDNQGNPDGDPSRSDGKDGSGEGNKGGGAGRDESGNDGDSGSGTGGAGVGEYDGSGDGVFGRKVTYVNRAQLAKVMNGVPQGQMGKIVIKVCIDKKGIPRNVEPVFEQTTIKDKKVLKDALALVKGYKYDPDPNAPSEQCGLVKLNIDKINAFGG